MRGVQGPLRGFDDSIIGQSDCVLCGQFGQHAVNFAEDFRVFKQVLHDRARWAGRDAGAAAFAQRLVDDGLLTALVERDGGVGAERDAGFAAAALVGQDVGRVRILFNDH